MRTAARRSLRTLVAALGLGLVVAAAWLLDTRRTEGTVPRRVTLAGRPVGGLTGAEVARVVAEVASEVPGRRIEVKAPGGGFSTDAGTLGLAVVEADTVDSALSVGREGAWPSQLWRWARSFVATRPAPVRFRVDEAAVYATVAARDPDRRAPVEPSVRFAKGTFTVSPGRAGRGIDPRSVIEELPEASLEPGAVVVRVRRGRIGPRFPDSMAEALAADLEERIASPLTVTAGGVRASVAVRTARSWMRSEVSGTGLVPAVDPEPALRDLRRALAKAGEPAVESRFTVEGGRVRIVPGTPGTMCCDPAAAAVVEAALLSPTPDRRAEVPLTGRPPDLTAEEAAGLGVVAPVGTFTTRHQGGEPRVQNIHRIADLVRGTLILPGRSLSINEVVGRRTQAKGFVSAPAIENGVLTSDVGGGVSQFATTLFNAAFFAGLEFGEYQSHSLRISRYPYGREATMGYPHPDLVIENPSPHGVLVWPTYTGTSITVTLYSTRWAEGAQTGQSEVAVGPCTRVTTERTRTFVDGRTEVDKVYATYRPAEGVKC